MSCLSHVLHGDETDFIIPVCFRVSHRTWSNNSVAHNLTSYCHPSEHSRKVGGTQSPPHSCSQSVDN